MATRRRADHVRPRPPSGGRPTPVKTRPRAPAPGRIAVHGPVRRSRGIPLVGRVALGIGVVVGRPVRALHRRRRSGRRRQHASAGRSTSFVQGVTATPTPSTTPAVVARTRPRSSRRRSRTRTRTRSTLRSPSRRASPATPTTWCGSTSRSRTRHRPRSTRSRSRRSPRMIIPVTLTKGINDFSVTLVGPGGESESSPLVRWVLDTDPPVIKLTSPKDGAKINAQAVTLKGRTQGRSTLNARNMKTGQSIGGTAAADGTFSLSLPIDSGTNPIRLTVTDPAGNQKAARALGHAARLRPPHAHRSALSFYSISQRQLPQQIRLVANVDDPDGTAARRCARHLHPQHAGDQDHHRRRHDRRERAGVVLDAHPQGRRSGRRDRGHPRPDDGFRPDDRRDRDHDPSLAPPTAGDGTGLSCGLSTGGGVAATIRACRCGGVRIAGPPRPRRRGAGCVGGPPPPAARVATTDARSRASSGTAGSTERRQPLTGDEIRGCWEAWPTGTVNVRSTRRSPPLAPARTRDRPWSSSKSDAERVGATRTRRPSRIESFRRRSGSTTPSPESGWVLWGDLERLTAALRSGRGRRRFDGRRRGSGVGAGVGVGVGAGVGLGVGSGVGVGVGRRRRRRRRLRALRDDVVDRRALGDDDARGRVLRRRRARAGTVGSKASVFAPGARPAVTISWTASASVLLRRSGIGTCSTPDATVTFGPSTRDRPWCLPAGPGRGSCPTGWSDVWSVTSSLSPTDSASWVASARSLPTNSGTATCWVGGVDGPDSIWKTMKPIAASSRIAAMPAIHTTGLVRPRPRRRRRRAGRSLSVDTAAGTSSAPA